MEVISEDTKTLDIIKIRFNRPLVFFLQIKLMFLYLRKEIIKPMDPRGTVIDNFWKFRWT